MLPTYRNDGPEANNSHSRLYRWAVADHPPAAGTGIAPEVHSCRRPTLPISPMSCTFLAHEEMVEKRSHTSSFLNWAAWIILCACQNNENTMKNALTHSSLFTSRLIKGDLKLWQGGGNCLRSYSKSRTQWNGKLHFIS